jgi:hypothetical protein
MPIPKLLKTEDTAAITHTITVKGLVKVSGRDDTFVYTLLSTGEVTSVIVGDRRRHIYVASWERYLRRCDTGEQLDPEERAANILAYRKTLDRKGARQMAVARQALLEKKAAGEPRNKRHRARAGLQRGHELSGA